MDPQRGQHKNKANSISARVAARFCKHGRLRTAAPSASHPKKRPLLTLLGSVGALGLLHVTGIGAIALIGAHIDTTAAQSSRALTSSESALTRALFGADFRTDNITLYMHENRPDHAFTFSRPSEGERLLGYVSGVAPNNVHMVAPSLHASDYGRTSNMFGHTELFIHEIAHVWQNRQPNRAEHCDVYAYTLNTHSRFGDFCSEQQADILADYAIRHLMPNRTHLQATTQGYVSVRMMGGTYTAQHSTDDANLIRVIEDHFPHARAARLQITRGNMATLECVFNSVSDRAAASLRRVRSNIFTKAFNICAAQHMRTLDGQVQTHDAEIAAPSPPAGAQSLHTRPAAGSAPA